MNSLNSQQQLNEIRLRMMKKICHLEFKIALLKESILWNNFEKIEPFLSDSEKELKKIAQYHLKIKGYVYNKLTNHKIEVKP